ncbi:chymotrypsin-elastase inhibitor ixodidin-like [Amblyomma americanum]
MKMCLVIVLLKFLAFNMHSVVSDEDAKCGLNAIFRSCGSACPAVCGEPRRLETCDKPCVPGCVCKPGYVLSQERKKCISAMQCLLTVAQKPQELRKYLLIAAMIENEE